MKTRSRGLTLVEVLVVAALSVILIGLMVAVTGQVQSAVNISSNRLLAFQQFRAIADNMEMDLGRIIPVPDGAPAPFANEPPIALTRNGALIPPEASTSGGYSAVSAPGDPPGFLSRCADSLQVFAAVSDTYKSASNPNPPCMAQAVVRYEMDGTYGTGGQVTPQWSQPPGGGPKVGHVRRHLLKILDPGAGALTLEATPGANNPGANPYPPALADNVISFQLDWLDGRTRDAIKTGGKSSDIFLPPDPPNSAPFNASGPLAGRSTSNGTLFCYKGQATVAPTVYMASPNDGQDGPRIIGADPSSDEFLSLIPVGGDIELIPPALPPPSPVFPPVRFAVRGPAASPPVKDISGHAVALLNDRTLLPAGTTVTARTMIPPAAVRLTMVFLFGYGPENQTARFVRVLPVSR